MSKVTPNEEFTFINVLGVIENVTNWKDLGVQLGVNSSRLTNIEEEQLSEEDRKQQMIQVWMKLGEASWETLQNALETPAMCENTAAKGIAMRRGSSFDSQSVLLNQSIGASDSSGSNVTVSK